MALPSNFNHLSRGLDALGVLHIQLTWLSDSGTLRDLDDCEFREEVVYDQLPCPAFNWMPPNPTHGRTLRGSQGNAPDIHIRPTLAFPRLAGRLIARQHYQYRSPATNNQWNNVPGHLYIITRELLQRSRAHHPSQWVYRICKESRFLGGFRAEHETVMP